MQESREVEVEVEVGVAAVQGVPGEVGVVAQDLLPQLSDQRRAHRARNLKCLQRRVYMPSMMSDCMHQKWVGYI